MNECVTLVSTGENCWLTSVLYIFNLADITPDMEQLLSIPSGEVLSSIVNKLKSMFEEKSSMKLQIPQNFSYTATPMRNLGKKSISMRLSTTNIGQRLPNSADTFPAEIGRWSEIPREERVCPLCL